MIYTLSEYSKAFLFGNKKVSCYTVRRRLLKGMLPSNHKVSKKGGTYIIEVPDKQTEKIKT
jgi:hypothetical protein